MGATVQPCLPGGFVDWCGWFGCAGGGGKERKEKEKKKKEDDQIVLSAKFLLRGAKRIFSKEK